MSEAKQVTSAQNIEFFDGNHEYIDKQSALEHYQHIQRSVERELIGIHRLLDIGNGGFFNYDTHLVNEVIALDLFLKDGPGPTENSTFRAGSILNMPFPDESFDGLLLQNVFHHITGESVGENFHNLQRSVQEMYRCLRPGGKVIIVESTVGQVFQVIERVIFPQAVRSKSIINRLWNRSGHPATFQFTPNQILEVSNRCGFKLEELAFVPRGAFVLQLGYKWPSALTPAKPIKLILRRPSPTVAAGRDKKTN